MQAQLIYDGNICFSAYNVLTYILNAQQKKSLIYMQLRYDEFLK